MPDRRSAVSERTRAHPLRRERPARSEQSDPNQIARPAAGRFLRFLERLRELAEKAERN